jgi:CheY-like chemotaxis protein
MAWFALRRTQDELQGMRRLEEETAHRQRIELALIQSQKLEAMGRLAGGIAHDFNNLMMIVSNNLYLLRHLYPNLVESQQLEAIERAVGSGTKLTRQILAFSRQQPLKPERILMQERIPGLLDLLQPVLGRSIEVTGHAAEDTAAINIDPAELELALINLAVNAKDAMPGGGRLGIVARNASLDDTHGLNGSFVVLEVSDTGTGIDPGVIDRVFEPFFTTKPVGYGTGLGLSQVHALCKRAGGTARITSDASGTVVSLLLPQQDDPLESASKTHVLPTRRLSCRLLLVEDNEALAEGTAELLQAMGCRVRRVRDGKSALSSVEGEPFDVVLSDIEMPGGLDGIALATAFGERYPALPILLMSGYASRLDEAIRRGFTVLPKPCTPQVLAEALHNALAGTRNQVA